IHTSLHLVRDINEIKRFGIDLMDVVRAAPELVVWGWLGPARPETAMFPGLTMIAVAVIAMLSLPRAAPWRARQSRDQRWLSIGSLVAALVALSTVTVGP